jgi:hypothetical protein
MRLVLYPTVADMLQGIRVVVMVEKQGLLASWNITILYSTGQ